MNLPLFEPEVKANLERAAESLQEDQLLYHRAGEVVNHG
jgi:hypothetical protein